MNKRLMTLVFFSSPSSHDIYWGHIHDHDWYYDAKQTLRPSTGMGVLWM